MTLTDEMNKYSDDDVMALFLTVIIHTPAEYVIDLHRFRRLFCFILMSFLTHMSIHPAITSLTDLSPYHTQRHLTESRRS